ncbi:MAG: hypothetical protein ACJ746_27375 [Bryobacteraceae bacterium]
MSSEGRRRTGFEVRTYLSGWANTGQVPYGPLFQAAMGAEPEIGQELVVAWAPTPVSISTTTPHGRVIGSGVSDGREIRFVSAVADSFHLTVNVPFSRPLAAGTQLNPTVSYRLATDLPSLTIYDYWEPLTAISRIITGAAVNIMDLSVNGDRHEFTFSGPAADLVDSASFSVGTAGLGSFPSEPALEVVKTRAVPGHLGQAWLGGTASEFFTITEASIQLQNNIDLRNKEFGFSYPRAAIAGQRQVNTAFSLFARDDSQTLGLYSAAKNQAATSMMLQMGAQKGQLMGAYLPSVIPVVPVFDDAETRLRWRFKNNVVQGTSDDELYIAFA